MSYQTLANTYYKPTCMRETTPEMKDLFRENQIYEISYTVDGECYLITDEYMDLVLIAMNTNSLNQMTAEERDVWESFVTYEDEMSWSAIDDGKLIPDVINSGIGGTNAGDSSVAIGASYVLDNGLAYVVNKNGITNTIAERPNTGFANQKLGDAIDKRLMQLLDCDTSNVCGILEGNFYNPYDDYPNLEQCPL